jgi:hypothetical protein
MKCICHFGCNRSCRIVVKVQQVEGKNEAFITILTADAQFR